MMVCKFAALAVVLMAGIGLLLIGCTGAEQQSATATLEVLEGTVESEVEPATTREASACPALDSLLLQLVEADDGLALAEQLQLPVREEKVQVLVVMAGESTEFLSAFEADLGTQSGNEIQVYVPVDQLCPLSQADEVLAVRTVGQVLP